MSDLLNQASLVMVPSGYKEDTVYSVVPSDGSGDLSFTRASNGTRINSAGLVEVCPWNLASYSEEFSNATWTKSATTLSANTTVAPNGTTTADTLIENTANSSHQIFQSITNVNGATPYTAMIYVKENANRNVAIRIQDGAFTYGQVVVTYNLNTGALISQVVTGNAVIVSTSATLTNGYYLIAVSFSINLSTSFRYDVLMVNGTSNSYTGDGTSSIVIWGAQLNIGSTAKPYFPTTDRLNVPRLTYQNGGGGCPSLLLEPQRTNIALRSEEFDNASSWTLTNSGTITANSTISPDGTQTADTLNAGANFAQVQQAVTGTSGAVYTVSIWIKRITGTGNVFLRAVENADTLIAVTSDWQRFTATVTSTTTTIRIGVKLATSGDAVAIWGGQIEAGAYPTTYIPTTSATATRIADSFSRNNIYTNGLISASGGTWFVELRNNVAYTRDASSSELYIGEDATSGLAAGKKAILIRNSGGGSVLLSLVYWNGSSIIPLHVLSTSTIKLAIKLNGTTADVFSNGTKVVTSASVSLTLANMQNLNALAGVPMFIQQMTLFPTPLSDTDCTTLTTL